MRRNIRAMVIILAMLFTPRLMAGPADWATVLKDTELSIPRMEIADGDDRGICSAVVINESGYALTAAHCIPDKLHFDLTVNERTASVVRVNRLLDMAVVRFHRKHEKALTLAPQAPVKAAEIALLGYPFGSETFHVQAGIVSAPYSRDCKCMMLNVDVIPGDSGGAVVDNQGRLVGLTTAVFYSGPSHLAAAVPVEAIRDFVEPYLPAVVK